MKKLIFMLNAVLIAAAVLTIMPIKSMKLSLETQLLQNLATNLNDTNYETNQPIALACINAKADIHTTISPGNSNKSTTIGNLLLEHATRKNDIELVGTLFEHNVDPNAQSICNVPLFFYAKDPYIIKMFTNEKVNVHAIQENGNTNVLRRALHHKYPAQVLQLYLQQGVDPRNISSTDGSCLFHELATLCQTYKQEYRRSFFSKSYLLVMNFPDMINRLNISAKTPLDIAQEVFDIEEKYTRHVTEYRMNLKKKTKRNDRLNVTRILINLYKKIGGLTCLQLIEKECGLEVRQHIEEYLELIQIKKDLITNKIKRYTEIAQIKTYVERKRKSS